MMIRRTFLALAALIFIAACEQPATPAAPTGDISQAELLARIEAGNAPLILDVRGVDEYAEGHLPGAINIPHTEIAERINELGIGQTDEIVIHCYSGKRAGMAEQTLQAAGFENIRMLDGQWQGWEAAGLPTE
ncbi:MAG: rhodanese-like domain-containing protein [Gammaproteobacteria bacterium]